MPAYTFFYFLLGLVGAAETGVLAYLVNKFENQGYPAGRGDNGTSNQMRVLIILLLFVASWTTLFALAFVCFLSRGSFAFLAGLGASLLWLVVTIILWAVSTTLFHRIRPGGECRGEATISICRQLETVEALGWTAVGLAALCMIAALFAWNSRRTYTGVSPYLLI
ncbi:hypothetical protein FRC20_010555 [Serendipita sp. 405]|nr:hypothetical protein FRC16_010678 [Serendipita sp. 398]KAG8871447.1 hypothetical protein FRC20_010555 [Serendipita sp. 405]